VALFNTIGKFSASIAAVSELSQDFWAAKQAEEPTSVLSPPVEHKAAAAAAADNMRFQMQAQTDVKSSGPAAGSAQDLFRLMDTAMGVVVRAKGGLTQHQEDALVDSTLAGDSRTLLLAKHYGGDVTQFTRHALRQLATAAGGVEHQSEQGEHAAHYAALSASAPAPVDWDHAQCTQCLVPAVKGKAARARRLFPKFTW